MAMMYPPFNKDEWDFLSPDLSIVDKAVSFDACENKLRELDKLRESLVLQESLEGRSIFNEIQDEVKEGTQFDGNEKSRKDTLFKLIEDYREVGKFPDSSLGKDFKLQEIREEIINTYYRFDLQTFREDFKDILAADGKAADSVSRQIQRVNGKRGSEIRNRRELIASVAGCCKSGKLPNRLGTITIRPDMSDEIKKMTQDQIAETILRRFVQQWKERIPQFEVPVSIYGTALHTMPIPRRQIWLKAMNDLGYQGLVGTRVKYQWIKSAERKRPYHKPPHVSFDNKQPASK